MLELFFFHVSSFLLMWIYYQFIVALVINIILGAFLLFFVRNGMDILSSLYIEESETVSGKFKTLNQNIVDIDMRGKKNAPYSAFVDERY